MQPLGQQCSLWHLRPVVSRNLRNAVARDGSSTFFRRICLSHLNPLLDVPPVAFQWRISSMNLRSDSILSFLRSLRSSSPNPSNRSVISFAISFIARSSSLSSLYSESDDRSLSLIHQIQWSVKSIIRFIKRLYPSSIASSSS